MDDKQIIDLFVERSENAISALSDKYGDLCKKAASNILADNRDVEECLNDTWLGVWNTVPPQRPDPLSTYVVRIAKNISINRLRRVTAQKRSIYLETSLDELEDCIPAAETGKNDDGSEIRLIVERFLDGLNTESRVIFVKRYWFSESFADIAKDIGVSEGNIKVKLFRLRKKLKAQLESEGVYI